MTATPHLSRADRSVLFVLGDPVRPTGESPASTIQGWDFDDDRVRLLADFGPGAWTILPALPALEAEMGPDVDWLFVAPADLAHRQRDIAAVLADHDSRSELFVGRALRDARPTAIHHYHQDGPPYPDGACGFALSRPLVARLAAQWTARVPTPRFHIDAEFELATAVRDLGVSLTHEPRLVPARRRPASPAPAVATDEVVFAVKTHAGNHRTRIPSPETTAGAGDAARSIVAFETGPGEGFNLMRHALVRVVLAVQQAEAARRSHSPRREDPLVLALAPISRTPHIRPDGHPPDGLRWSRLIDVAHLSEGTGLVVLDLDEVAAADPALTWRLVHLTRRRPLGATYEEYWSPSEPPPATSAQHDELAATVCRCRPRDWLRWESVRRVDAHCTPGSEALTREILAGDGLGTRGLFLAPAEQITWGRFYGSTEFWRVVQALRPAPHLRDLAEQHRPAGPYLGVHWRRGDFTTVHAEVSPSPQVAADQIAEFASMHALATVFVATDAGEHEIRTLSAATGERGLRCKILPTSATAGFSDLEHSVVEQAILFGSDCFVGTRHSMFTAAVFETREAAGSPPNATWNVLCGDAHHPGVPDDDEYGRVAPRHPYR